MRPTQILENGAQAKSVNPQIAKNEKIGTTGTCQRP